MSEFGVDFVVGRKKVTVAGAAKGSKDTLGHLFEHLVPLSHLEIDKTLSMVFVLVFLKHKCLLRCSKNTCIFFFKMPLSQLPLRAFQSLQMRPLFLGEKGNKNLNFSSLLKHISFYKRQVF